jgi:hypothetical protein
MRPNGRSAKGDHPNPPPRHGDAEHEQRHRRRGVLQERQRVHDRDRKLEMQRCGEGSGASRHDQRIEHDLADHDAKRVQQGPVLAGECKQQRYNRKQKDGVAAEDQRGGRGSLRPEHRQRQTRAHIADIAERAGKTRQGRFTERQPPEQPPHNHGQNERAGGAERGCDQKWRVVEFRKRRLRHDAEQQGRQRNVEQEEVHPGQACFRQVFGFSAGKADEDQPEIRQRQIEDIHHGQNVFFFVARLESGARRVSSGRVKSAVCP